MKDMETTISMGRVAASSLLCPWCTGPVDVKSRHVAVAGSAVKVYCSEDCLQAAAAGVAALSDPESTEVAPRRRPWLHVTGIAVGLLSLSLFGGGRDEWRPQEGAPTPVAAAAVAAPAPEPPAPVFGPPWPPTEAAWAADLAQDAWIHPLAGPGRRMPKHHGRVFGAERPGDRPAECLSGHCGVDLGGEVWGEPVLAVHDGVVDRVNRGPNEDHGGVYVRIAHRGGSVFTQYFHLAAVPRWIKEGTETRAGQVVGLLGDTGVKRSGPHLHFTISVKPSRDLPEQYIDPEPIIALWPLWMPDGMGTGRVSTVEPPGVPIRGSKKKKARQESAFVDFVDTSAGPSPASVPAPTSVADGPETGSPATATP
jgi:murein DD-endopeptidase MepM/ murein hydrolase activator NlpD